MTLHQAIEKVLLQRVGTLITKEITKRLGLNSQSYMYLAGYVDRDVNIPRIDVLAIGKAIDRIERVHFY